ncbi:MAG: hypothetical protein HUK26_03560, partial [Duodenibacillus sp.]|nr:hypothetical protein [Duodenibacillus sp.]
MKAFLKPLALTAAAAAMLACGGASAYDFQSSFSYYANGHSLRTVLASFAQRQGLHPDFLPGVAGRVSGRFSDVPGDDFMQAMTDAYGVRYYVLGDTIHFYPAGKAVKRSMTVRLGSGKLLVDQLKKSGHVADELPVQVNDSGTLLTVRGPKAYVDGFMAAAKSWQTTSSQEIEMRVFPIKYAWADDVKLSNMDRDITVPGVASILRGMVMNLNVGGETVSQQKGTTERVQRLGAPGVSGSLEGKKDEEAISPFASGSSVSTGNVSIIADPRVNAVLVKVCWARYWPRPV